jgi:predicted ATPase
MNVLKPADQSVTILKLLFSTKLCSNRGKAYLLIRNNLLVKLVDMSLLLAVCRAEQSQEIADKLLAVIFNVFLRIFADEKDLSDVAFALDVTIVPHRISMSLHTQAKGKRKTKLTI